MKSESGCALPSGPTRVSVVSDILEAFQTYIIRSFEMDFDQNLIELRFGDSIPPLRWQHSGPELQHRLVEWV